MPMKELIIRVKDSTVSAVDLAKWIKENWEESSLHPSRYLLLIARNMIDGVEWKPKFHTIHNIDENNPFVEFEVIITENEYEKHFRLQREYHTLLENGAAGDAEAAVKYCQLELAGKVSHWWMA